MVGRGAWRWMDVSWENDGSIAAAATTAHPDPGNDTATDAVDRRSCRVVTGVGSSSERTERLWLTASQNVKPSSAGDSTTSLRGSLPSSTRRSQPRSGLIKYPHCYTMTVNLANVAVPADYPFR